MTERIHRHATPAEVLKRAQRHHAAIRKAIHDLVDRHQPPAAPTTPGTGAQKPPP